MSDLVFALERNNWRWYGRDLNRLTRLPGRVRLRTFEDAEAAQKERAALEAEVRGRVNPFRCGVGLGALTTFDTGRLRDWLLDADLEPPASMAVKELEAWWDAANFSDVQRVRVWEGLDRVRFHEEIRRPRRPVVYVVVEVQWEYNDYTYNAGAEGGNPVLAFRDRAKAEAFCRERNAKSRESWDEMHGADIECCEVGAREAASVSLTGPQTEIRERVVPSEALFWEVYEVEEG